MTDEAKALVERCKGHTPGPWRWEVNRSHKSVKLCGGSPKHGFGRYDLTVMDFSRYGMNKAAPVFWNWRDGPFLVGDPKRADELAVEVQGREHHANWFADIDHPDAQLVAAAPELLDLIETQAREIERLRPTPMIVDRWIRAIDNAANLIETQAREIERLKEAIKVQASAVRTLQANEETEINTLRQQKQEWHHAVSSLDSEREANAILTDEIERLRGVLKQIAYPGETVIRAMTYARAALGDSHGET